MTSPVGDPSCTSVADVCAQVESEDHYLYSAATDDATPFSTARNRVIPVGRV